MQKTKRRKVRLPNPNKKTKQKPPNHSVSTMKLVTEPVVGRFYAIDTAWWNDIKKSSQICLYSGREEVFLIGRGGIGTEITAHGVHEEIEAGSMVMYLGTGWNSVLGKNCHKIWHGEYHGFVIAHQVIFYDLGEL